MFERLWLFRLTCYRVKIFFNVKEFFINFMESHSVISFDPSCIADENYNTWPLMFFFMALEGSSVDVSSQTKDTSMLFYPSFCRVIILAGFTQKQQAIRAIKYQLYIHTNGIRLLYISWKCRWIIACRIFCNLHEFTMSLFFSSLITLYHLVRHTRWFFECYSKLIQKLPL
jgi:hypothetical protein